MCNSSIMCKISKCQPKMLNKLLIKYFYAVKNTPKIGKVVKLQLVAKVVVTCASNPATLEVVFRNAVGSMPVEGNWLL